jgi:hypothetical protein
MTITYCEKVPLFEIEKRFNIEINVKQLSEFKFKANIKNFYISKPHEDKPQYSNIYRDCEDSSVDNVLNKLCQLMSNSILREETEIGIVSKSHNLLDIIIKNDTLFKG